MRLPPGVKIEQTDECGRKHEKPGPNAARGRSDRRAVTGIHGAFGLQRRGEEIPQRAHRECRRTQTEGVDRTVGLRARLLPLQRQAEGLPPARQGKIGQNDRRKDKEQKAKRGIQRFQFPALLLPFPVHGVLTSLF